MAVWIEVATTAWGQLVRPGTNAPLANSVPQINTTVRATASDTGTVIAPADWKSDKDGLLPGFVAEGSWLFIEPDGQSRQVEATHGGTSGRVGVAESKITLIQEAPLNVKDSRFGAVGDGVADDTAAITAARALSAPYGRELFFPPGRYKDTAQRTLQSGENWKGAGGIQDANIRGVTTIEPTFNGEYLIVPNNCANWSIENLTLKGLRTLASQDLLACKQTGHGAVRKVGILDAGRDGVTLAASLNIHFDTVYHYRSKRHNLNTSGQANAIQWSKCLFREADMWGIRIGGGMNLTFIDPTIESNNNVASQTTGGGILMDPNDADTSAYINVVLVGAHFENHAGGKPVQSLVGPRGWSFVEYASTYNETTSCNFAAAGTLQSDNVVATVATHANLADVVRSAWINPRKDGGGAFALGGNGANSAVIVASNLPTAALPGIRIGDLELYRDANGHMRMATVNRRLINDGGFGTANTQAATTLGTLSNRMPLYNDAGNLVGYIPIYGTIT